MNNASSPSESTDVVHNAAEHRYEIRVGENLAVAEYEDRKGVRVMTHTFVPPELRGQGLAERLVRRALEEARDAQLQVLPACSYVATFIRRNKEFAALVPGSLSD
jgi:predicted GNAT family acetyltransferase